MDEWRDSDNPHIGAGGKDDGHIGSYCGMPRGPKGFHYSVPGLFTFGPIYMDVVAMVRLTADQANAITNARIKARMAEMGIEDES